ncbi:sensor histidine kinase [Microlunatus ginsengisoli]|uniref:histidine kinase n=1 Tax=Microlunatus ginsengisoli TaxID=363863 RepID=A0ABP7AQB9_9ACTN
MTETASTSRNHLVEHQVRDHPVRDDADLPEFLLYDTPAGADDVSDAEPAVTMIRGVGRNLGAICGLFVVTLVAFIVCTTLFSLGVSLLILVVGLFILVACLMVAGWTSRVTKGLLRFAGVALPETVYPPLGSGFAILRRLRDPQSWRDLLHVLVGFVVSTFSFSVAVSWVAGALGGITFWFWGRFLPEDNHGLAELLGFPGFYAEVILESIVGVLLLVSAPAVLSGLVRLHGAIARGLLVDERGALRRRVSQLTESRSAAGEAEAHTLRRLERDLHDGPQQRLVRLGMDISSAQRRLETDPDKAKELLAEAFEQSQEALTEIRQLSRGIAPPILTEQGLHAAITTLAARNSVPTTVDVGAVTLTDAAQNAAYFVVAESLTNMEKHSAASHCSVEVHQVGGVVVIAVTDDGVGGASLSRGHGLAGLADRLAGVDGTLTVTSPRGGPTQVTATLPALAG